MANSKEEVNIEKMYGQECILSKEDFIQKYHVKKERIIYKWGK